MKTILVLIICILIAHYSEAQSGKDPKPVDYKLVPAWITMMDDPNVDYHEAVKAFNIYWSVRIPPEEEEELITEGKATREQLDEFRAQRAKWTQIELNQYMEIKYQFKRFKDWKRTSFPFVQSDGRILSEQERMEIYQQQNQQRKEEEK